MNTYEMAVRVLGVLDSRPEDRPITGHAIAAILSTSLRNVTNAIGLLRDYGILISSSKTEPFGYAHVRDPLVMKRTYARMEKEAKMALKRVQSMKRNMGQPTIFDEMALAVAPDITQPTTEKENQENASRSDNQV